MADNSENRTSDQSDLEKIAAILLRHSVEFLIVGGQAEVLMGSPRVTYDTDLCYGRTKENLERLADALQEMKPIDLLGWVEPLGTYESLLPASETYTVGDLTLRTIGLDDLIRIKQHIGRAKDQESLLQLLAIRSLRNEGQVS